MQEIQNTQNIALSRGKNPVLGEFCLRSICVHKVTQNRFKRVQMALEIAPAANALAVDGLANLLRAGGFDGALGFVKLQALRLEWQVAKIENAADIGLGLGNQIFVDHPQHLARQNRIPMPHQIDIIGKIAR